MLHMYVFLNKSQDSIKKRNIIKLTLLKRSGNVNDRRKLNSCHV